MGFPCAGEDDLVIGADDEVYPNIFSPRGEAISSGGEGDLLIGADTGVYPNNASLGPPRNDSRLGISALMSGVGPSGLTGRLCPNGGGEGPRNVYPKVP